MYEAARIDDPIAHSSALAGFLVGALLGIALIATVAFCTITCGFGAGLIAGLLATGGAYGLLAIGEAIGRSIKSVAGKILTGSPNVFVNSKPAARVELSTVQCDNHVPVKRIAEGSTNVFINTKAAARKDDRTECDATINAGSANVFFGGGSYAYLPIEPEIPAWLREAVDWAFAIAGILGGLAGAIYKGLLKNSVKCVAKYLAGQMVGELAGRYVIGPAISGLVGNPVDVTRGRKVLLQDTETDFSLPGRLPIVCSRFYSSDLEARGLLGKGWRLDWEISLRRTDDALIYIGPQGRELSYPLLEPGHQWFDPAEQLWLSRLPDGRYTLHSPDMYYHVFGDFTAEGLAHLCCIEDSTGQRILFLWDERGQLLKLRGDCGHELHMHYELFNDSPRLVTIERVAGGDVTGLVHYEYDENGQLSEVRDRTDTLVRRFRYEQGLMSEHANATDFICRYRWQDVAGTPRVVEHTTSEGACYRFSYNLGGRHTQVTDVFGHTAHWYWDEQEQITHHIDYDGAESRFEYNADGWPVRLYLPGERVVKVEYDALNRIVSETDPLGQVTETHWHASTFLVTRTELDDGRCWQARYDERGLLLSRSDPLGHQEKYTRRESGLTERITDARGGVVTLEHDLRGQVTCYTDCSGKSTHYEYNPDGHPVLITNALGQSTALTWTAGGQPATVRRPDLKYEHYRWNALGLLIRHTHPTGHTERWEYTSGGQLSRHTDAENRSVVYQRDAHGRLTTLINGNGACYRFSYDAAGRPAGEVRPDGTERCRHFDVRGFLLRTDEFSRGRQHHRYTVHEHDALGRQTNYLTAHSQTRYQYNRLGQLDSAVRNPTPTGERLGIEPDTVRLEYDDAGRLIAEHTVNGELRYERDELSNPLRITLPDGRALETLYYGSGHVHQVNFAGLPIAEFERDDLHRQTVRSQGRLSTRSDYTSTGQLAQQQVQVNGEGKPVLWRHSLYNDSLELVTSKDQNGVVQYAYDRSGYLTFKAGEYFDVERFAWDAAGNLLDDEHPQSLMDNLLRRYRGREYYYDEWGQDTGKQSARDDSRFEWDAEGHLINVRHGSERVHYHYDALSRRIRKTRVSDNGRRPRSTGYLWQGLRLLQEREEDDSNRTYLYDSEMAYSPLACVDQAGGTQRIYHYHTDPSGTAREVTDDEGKVVWSGYYRAWGGVAANVTPEAVAFTQNLRMPGQYYDEESGLHYNTFRYYDPATGRFISPDPIGLAGGLNLYAYAPNPLSWIDPLGLAGCSAQFKSRNEAFRAAKRDAGIPMNQQPDRIFNHKTGFYGEHRHVPLTDSRKNPLFDSNGNQVWTREYQFTRVDGSKIVIQDHSVGHSYPNGIGNQGPHLNIRPIENTRTGSVTDTFDHYEF